MPDNDNENIEYPKYNEGLKIFRNEPYHTPNNYDLYFDQNKIPANIEPEPAASLQKKLQKLMPVSKIIHLNMNTETLNPTNHLLISTKMKINNHEVKFI